MKQILLQRITQNIAVVLLLLTACTTSADPQTGEAQDAGSQPSEATVAELEVGQKLRVVATTNLIADVVAQIGGEHIALSTLIPTGSDPHSYETNPKDLVTLNDAHVIFMNGLHYEVALQSILDTTAQSTAVVSVNDNIETIDFDEAHEDEHADEHAHEEDEHADEHDHEEDDHEEDEHADEHDHEEDEHGDEHGHDEDEHGDAHEHEHGDIDPHTWFSVRAVVQWVENITPVLSELDPANAAAYQENAQRYLAELETLAAELDKIVAELPTEKRVLVTDHEVLGYFAAQHEFQVIGMVIPSLSTAAAPSAGMLAEIQDQIQENNVPAIFVGGSANPTLVNQIAEDLDIQVVTIYTESLSESGGPADSYIEFMRYNTRAIVDALK